MPDLILHVGPGKCGSSSIQGFFASQKNPCLQKTRYKLLNPADISELNHDQPSEKIMTDFTKLVSNNLRCDALILSHEFLFQCAYAVRNICNLAKNLVNKIVIVGYSRQQSDRLVSAYSQWYFRSPEIIKEVSEVLNTLEIDPVLFSGLERHLIASIVNDFYSVRQVFKHNIMDWFHSYENMSQLVGASGAYIRCGLLPKKDSNISLIQDFCEKCELTLRDKTKDVSNKVANLKFNKDIVEAIYNAVDFGLDMPGPHVNNSLLHHLSSMNVKTGEETSDFFLKLKSYIDTYFLDSNRHLCQKYDLNEDYFEPAERISKSDILDIIKQEGQKREANKADIINDYRMLSARMIELCLRVIKDKRS